MACSVSKFTRRRAAGASAVGRTHGSRSTETKMNRTAQEEILETWQLVLAVRFSAVRAHLQSGSVPFDDGADRDLAGAGGDFLKVPEWDRHTEAAEIAQFADDDRLCRSAGTAVSETGQGWNLGRCHRGPVFWRATPELPHGLQESHEHRGDVRNGPEVPQDLLDEAPGKLQRPAVYRGPEAIKAALFVDFNAAVGVSPLVVTGEQAQVYEAEKEQVAFGKRMAGVGRQWQGVCVSDERARVRGGSRAVREYRKAPSTRIDPGDGAVRLQAPVPACDQEVPLAELGNSGTGRAGACSLNSVLKLLLPAWRLIDLQRDPGLPGAVPDVTAGEVACGLYLALQLPPVPSAQRPPVRHLPVFAFDDRDGGRGDGNQVTHTDQMG